MKADCPPPYKIIAEAFREIIPTLVKQSKDPSYFVVRPIPSGSGKMENASHIYKASATDADEDGYVQILSHKKLPENGGVRFDLDDQTFAVYKTGNGQCHISEGICTHGNTHLSDGMVVDDQIECPKHNGRFRIMDGSPQRPPVCDALKTNEVIEKEGYIYLDLKSIAQTSEITQPFEFRMISNDNVTTFIKELVLEPLENDRELIYQPGDYLKLEIPPHQTSFKSIHVQEPYKRAWKEMNLYQYHSFSSTRIRRNYSIVMQVPDPPMFST
jgi:nitrite reductase/ring-hydroxylating ferredoxin subunit